ncbi:MAG: hypothetical protein AAF499_15840, partial [Pseudomonadota bacterium]
MFLLKPHVVGPQGDITSPDVIVDRLFVDGAPRSLANLSHAAWQQLDADCTVEAGYGVMALGGGALILPSLVLATGLVVVGRCAWRLHNLDNHIGEVTLNGASLSALGLPSEQIAAAGGSADTLPRGYLIVCTAQAATCESVLCDPVLKRELPLRLHRESLEDDAWGGERPKPRYSVGP